MKNPNAWYGFRRDQRDARDHIFRPTAGRVPTKVDLRDHCPPIMDQGQIGSCTAHGITGALRYEMIRQGGHDVPLSRLQLYYSERAIEGTIMSDAGAEIRDGIKCAANLGVCHEDLWPYDVKKFTVKPPAACASDALSFAALSYQRIAITATDLKHAIAAGHTPIIGITVYDSFESLAVEKTGVVPMPKISDKPVGGHCMFVVGYGQRAGYFTVQNSWAADWGDKGYCYLPERYLGSSKYGADYWMISAEGALAKSAAHKA